MTSSTDEQFGGGFADVRDGEVIEPVIRPDAKDAPDAATP